MQANVCRLYGHALHLIYGPVIANIRLVRYKYMSISIGSHYDITSGAEAFGPCLIPRSVMNDT